MEPTKENYKKKSILAKTGKILGYFILSVIALIVLVILLIQTSPVQNYARKKIVTYLETKLKTKVQLSGLNISFPKMLVLQGVYIEDRAKDTLLAGKELKVDIDMLKLLHSEIQINEINLNQVTAKIKRQLQDTTFNYQFIVDAFSSPAKTPQKEDTSAFKIAIKKIIIDKTRLVYTDVVTGNDVAVYIGHFDTNIKTFDMANQIYDVPDITLKGFSGKVHQMKPLVAPVEAVSADTLNSSSTQKFLSFTNQVTKVSGININYENDISKMSAQLIFKDLIVHPKSFDLKNSIIALNDITLNNLDGFLKMGGESVAKAVKPAKQNIKAAEVAPASPMPWKFTINSISFNDNKFKYDDNTQPLIKKGMDYSHLDLQNLTLHADSFLFHKDTIAANIAKGEMKEKSGFELRKFQTNVVYTDKGVSLQKLLIQTPGSEIKRSAVIRYPSLASIQKQMGLLEINVDIDNSFVEVKDILTFVPTLSSQPAFKNPTSKIYINTLLKGSLTHLVVDHFQFRGLGNTSIDIAGTVNNAMDTNNVNADITIKKFNTTRNDIVSLAPAGTIPKGVSLPETMSVNGHVKGGMKHLVIESFKFKDSRNTIIELAGVINNATNTKNIFADVNIQKFNINKEEIKALTPPGTIPENISLPESMSLNGSVKGGMKHLVLEGFQFKDSRNTTINLSGTVNNATDVNKLFADLNIKKFSISKGEILALAPPGSIPKTITIPQIINLTGKIKGGMKNAFADLSLNTSLGSVKVKGTISNPTDSIKAQYDATVSTTALNLGIIMQQPENLGLLTSSFTIKGIGYDPEQANATIKGNINSAEIKKYVYHNLNLDASIANQKFTANAAIKDPNIDFAINAEGNLGGNLPGFAINANIDSIKTFPLHLTPNSIIYHGKIIANFPEFNLDALNGRFDITNSVLIMNKQRISMDSISVVAVTANNQQDISLKSDFINADIHGQYKLQQLSDIMIEAIQPYYAIDTSSKQVNIDPYNFTINASFIDHPTLHALAPDLKRFDGINLKSNFSVGEGWNATIKAPYIVYGTNTLDNLTLNAAAGNSLNITTKVNQIVSGTSIILYSTGLTANIINNKINFGLSIKDKAQKTKYRLAGSVAQIPDSIYTFSLSPDSLLLNYDTWSINRDNLLRYGPSLVSATNFNLSKGNEHLIINSTNSTPASPLQVDFNNFNIATLTAFVQSDSLLIDGTLNGNVLVKDVLTQPNFTTDLTLNNFAVKKDTVGDINIKVNNNTQNVFATNITITGKGNDVNLKGNYYLKPANNSNFDFNLNIKQLPFKTIEAASMGSITQATGNLTGNIALNGTVQQPNVNGAINFNKTGFAVAMLGSYFQIDGQTISVDKEGIRFNNFAIRDSANNSLTINGLAGTSNFTNYNLGLTVQARNFRAINTTKKLNSLYYGQLYFNTNLSIKGTEVAPVVDGSLRINANTNLSIVLPQAEPGLVDRKGVIEFVDMKAPEGDTLFKQTLVTYDSSFNKTAVTGFDISLNVEVVKEANFDIIVDEGNGDFLNVKGAAVLNTGIDPSGKITMTGSYVIDQGSYDLSFNFLHRKFDIQQGSKITWTGEPTTANIDITAVYIANTSAMDLVQDQINDNTRSYYQQKLPFQVKLIMRGQLMQPDLSFDIALPTENNVRVSNEVLTTVNTRLDQVRAEPAELNKQVFALLLLNRFVGQDPFQSSAGGGGFNAGSFARQSVSKILTEQLNRLAGDLIKGVDISFDVNSADDYTTGERRDRTDFNVALSKRLLNDRLKVTVGSNYELEGPQQSNQTASNIIGNVSIDYNLSKDGRYLLRGYRKNDYEAVVEGYVIETGLKFIISVDYNKFKEIFQKRRKSKKGNNKAVPINTKANQATTGNAPAKNQNYIFSGDTILADNRKLIPASVKDSSDEN